MLRAQLVGRRKGSLVVQLVWYVGKVWLAYFMATCDRSTEERLQQPVKNICDAETSIRSRSVCLTTLMIELYPRRCWLRGPVKPMGLCRSSPKPAIRDTSILNCWSLAAGNQ